MKKNILDRQSLFDIAIQNCGSIEAVFKLAERHNLSITDELIIGEEIEYFAEDIIHSNVSEHYRKNYLYPSTALSMGEKENIWEGIGYWAINIDFRVTEAS